MSEKIKELFKKKAGLDDPFKSSVLIHVLQNLMLRVGLLSQTSYDITGQFFIFNVEEGLSYIDETLNFEETLEMKKKMEELVSSFSVVSPEELVWDYNMWAKGIIL